MLSDAQIIKKESGYTLRWSEHMERADSFYSSREAAAETYFIQLAYDYLGDAIRDNAKAQKIALGQDIEKYGVSESGGIDYPDGF